MNDLISRQAAIDEIEERKNANGYSNVAVISELNRLEGYIKELPSAEPERKKGKWIEKDVIHKDAEITTEVTIMADMMTFPNTVEEFMEQ